MLLTNAVYFGASDFQSLLVQAHNLDTDLCLLVFDLADDPFNNTEVYAFGLTCVETQVEGLCVEEVTLQTDGEALQPSALCSIALGGDSLIRLSKHLNVGVVRC